MKILVPYFDADNRNIDSPIISGGVEMFIKKLAKYIPEVITPQISLFDKSSPKQLRFRLDTEIQKHNPDLIVSNYNSGTYNKYLTGKYNIPVMWINHMSTGFMSSLGTMPLLHEHQKRGHSVYHVSPYQDQKWNALSKRLLKTPFKADGFVIPSVVEDNVLKIRIGELYDCSTVGRCEGPPDKDPFVLFRRVGHDFKTLVMSNPKTNAYYEEWKDHPTALWGLPHEQILSYIASSKTFMVTWPNETYGIIALEALSVGTPIIINAKDNEHASSIIPTAANQYRMVSTKDRKGQETYKAITELKKLRLKDREEIKQLTHFHYGVDSWRKKMYNEFDTVMFRHKRLVNRQTVMDFL